MILYAVPGTTVGSLYWALDNMANKEFCYRKYLFVTDISLTCEHDNNVRVAKGFLFYTDFAILSIFLGYTLSGIL